MRSALWKVVMALLLAVSLPSRAGSVTQDYVGSVSALFGPQSAVFQLGETIQVSYSLDTSVMDSNPDPGIGLFFGALQGLSVTLPRLGLTVAVGPGGTVQTFNGEPLVPGAIVSDQVFFRGGPGAAGGGNFIGNPVLDGAGLVALEVDFLSNFSTTPSTMLSSDALPSGRLAVIRPFVIFGTTAGGTFVDFQVAQVPEPSTAVLLLLGVASFVLYFAHRSRAGRTNPAG